MAAAQAACREREPAAEDRWQRARVERTLNMLRKTVTLDVSKRSGWLNAHAPCRESKERRAMRDEVGTRGREGRGQRRHKKRAGEGLATDLG